MGGDIADRWFRGRLRLLLLACYTVLVANFLWLIASMPSPFFPNVHCDYATLAVCISSTGLFAGASMPPTLELLAEVAYPVSEGTTGQLSSLVVQLAFVMMTAAVPMIAPDAVNTCIACVALISGLCLLPVRETTTRKDVIEPVLHEGPGRSDESDSTV